MFDQVNVTSILHWFSEIFGTNRWSRLVTVVFLFVIVIMSILLWDSYTNSFTLTPIERKIDLLVKLRDLETGGIQRSAELQDIYLGLVDELRTYDTSVGIFNDAANVDLGNPNFSQYLGGIIFWVILGIAFYRNGTLENSNTRLGLILLFFVSPFLSMISPDTENFIINFVIGFVLQVVILLALGRYANRTKPPQQTPSADS